MAQNGGNNLELLAKISISNFQAINLGDGKTVSLTWSVPDPASVKYFILEMWDVNSRRWTPFDGFHGYLSQDNNPEGNTPPLRATFEVPFIDKTVSFRVKSVAKDKTETDWSHCSSEVKVSGSEYAETNQFFVKSGLNVELVSGLNFVIRPGAAYMGGKRVFIGQDVYLRLPDGYNVTHVIYLSQEGTINYAPWSTNIYELNGIRLAKVAVGVSGVVTVTDIRYLWAPEHLEVTYNTGLDSLQLNLGWTPYQETNLRAWRIYRGIGSELGGPEIDEYKPIATVDSNIAVYDDLTVIPGNVYYYRLKAVDWGENESSFGPASYLDIPFSDYSVPLTPTGLQGTSGGVEGSVYADLTWDHNVESNVRGYRLWFKTPLMADWQLLDFVPFGINRYRHTNLADGMTIQYCISAENKVFAGSPRSDAIQVTVGDNTTPNQVEWAFVNPITTDVLGSGAYGSQTCWIKLKWDPVTTNNDGSAINDLGGYYVYDNSTTPKIRLATIDFRQPREWTGTSFLLGTTYRFVITAFDTWGKESVVSTEKSITAGGKIPKPPAEVTVEASGADGAIVTFSSVSQYTDDSTIPIPSGLDGYIIYRGINSFNLFEIGRMSIASPQPVTYQYQDRGLSKNVAYYYAVKAFRSSAVSEQSEVAFTVAGDLIAPNPPVWTSLTTRINEDSSIDNVLEWTTSQEIDLKGTWIYGMRPDLGSFEPLQFVPRREDGVYKFVHDHVLNNVLYTYQLRTEDTSYNLSVLRMQSIISGSSLRPSAPEVTAEGFYTTASGIRLTWPEVTTNDEATPTEVIKLRGYRIYRALPGFSFKQIADIPSGSPTYEYLDTELVNGKGYSYKITAYNALGNESYPCLLDNVIAGDMALPAQPVVVLVPEFLPGSPSTVTINLALSCVGQPSHYKILLSNDGIRWSAPINIPYSQEGSDYVYTAPYGSITYYKVSAVSIPGVEGLPREGNFQAVYEMLPSTIQNGDIAIAFEATDSNNFDAVITWQYDPVGNELDYFLAYHILYGSTTPVTIATISDSNTKTYRVKDLKSDIAHSFSVIVENIFGLKSLPEWVVSIPDDTTVPNAPASITASGKIAAISALWQPTTTNTDGSQCQDLYQYVLEIADNTEFNPVFRTVNLHYMMTNYLFDTTDTKFWYFRIKAVDRYGHQSSWTVSSGAKAIDIADYVEGGATPGTPTINEPLETGVTWKLDNSATPSPIYGEEPDIWVKLTWPQVIEANHYNVYASLDGVSYYFVGEAKDPGMTDPPATVSYTAHGLFPGTPYWFKITAANRFNGESQFSPVVTCTSSTVVRPIDSPTNFGIGIGKNLIAINWDLPTTMHNVVGGLLECRYTTDPPAGERVWSNWEPIYVGKGSYYIHTPLEYNKFYQYRVAIIDSAGNKSNYVPSDYDSRDYVPGQVGYEDIAVNAIHGNQISANTINAFNIAAEAIESRHLKSESITAGKIAAGAIRAQDLTLTMGGYNVVLNSAFGMKDFQGNFGMNWSFSGEVAVIEEDPSLSTVMPYCLRLYKQYEISGPISVTQNIPVTGMDGKTVTLSYDRWTQNITGTQCQVRLVVTTATGTTYLADDPIVGTTDWTRNKYTFALPTGIISIVLEITMYGTSTGTLKVTKIQLEDGDLATQWNPNGDEVYGAGGKVQINSAGIKVLDGAIDVASSDGKVKITGDGIIAVKSNDGSGNPLCFAKFDGEGLIVRGGAISISTAIDSSDTTPLNVSRVEITSEGIQAYENGIQTFEVNSSGQVKIWNGELSFLPVPPNTGKVILNNEGLSAYKNETDRTVVIDSATGNFGLYGGAFEIKTAEEGSINQGLILNHNGISAYRADNSRFFNLSIPDGKMYLYNGGFDISTAPEGQLGNKVTIDGTGINILDITGNKIIRMSGVDIPGEGVKMLLTGGFKIKSQAGNSSVVIDENGILGSFDGSGFELTRGHDGITPGLHITNGDINCGDVHINSSGITVKGANGIAIQSNDANPVTFVRMDHEGIKILEDKGIKLIGTLNPESDGGSIAFYPEGLNSEPTVAITGKHGIHANAIKVGVLTIDGTAEDNNPRIVVKDEELTRVIVDRSGIKVFDGSLSVTGSDGNVYIENGRILAEGLQIGIGGSNLIKNGRGGKLELSPWEGDAFVGTGLDVLIPGSSPPTKAGVSGRTAFEYIASTGQTFYQVVTDTTIGNRYTFSCWVYLISGSFDILFEHPFSVTPTTPLEVTPTAPVANIIEPIHIDPSVNEEAAYLGYRKFVVRLPVLTESDVPLTVKFSSTADNTHAFITDIMLTLGDMPLAFTNHANEMDASDSNVIIDDSGIRVTNGRFLMHTIMGSGEEYELLMNGLGVRLIKESQDIFSLDETGFNLNLPNKSVAINDSVGVKVTSKVDPNKYAMLDENGLGVYGGFINIVSEDGSLKINPNSITVEHLGVEKVKLDRSGLNIKDGAFNLSSSGENAALQITNDQIIVKNNTGKEIVVIGNTDGKPGYGGMPQGILINGAGFRLTNTDGGGTVSISDQEIRVYHSDGTYSRLTASGVEVFRTGDDNKICNYAKNVVVGGPVYTGETVTLGPMMNPKVIIVPAHFQTYHAESAYRDCHQYAKFYIITGRDENNNFKFTPYVTYPIYSTPQTESAISWTSKRMNVDILEGQHSSGSTIYDTATRLGVYCEWHGRHRGHHYVRFYVRIYWNDILVNEWYRSTYYSSTSTEWFWSGTHPPGKMRFDIYVTTNQSDCRMYHRGVLYYADLEVNPSGIQPQVNYLVIDG